MNKQDKLLAVDMFASGLSMRKIAKHFEVPYRIVSAALKEFGYTSDFRKTLPEKDVVDYYLSSSDITQTNVADKFGVSSGTISKVFKKHGIKIKSQHMNRPEVDEAFIIDKYVKQKKTLQEIADVLEISASTVGARLKSAGVTLRNNSECRQEYFLNEDYFEVIDTEAKAYWLGFMFADGYVSSNLRDFGITLKESDVKHIEKFIESIEYTGQPKKYPHVVGSYGHGFYVRVVPANRKVCADLISHGCIPRKTHHTDAPIGMPEDLNRHFIRGVVDGDGGLYLYEKLMSVEIVGDNGLLAWIKQNSPADLSDLQVHKSIWRLRTKKSSAIEFAKWLYEGSTVHLDRKYKRYLLAIEKFDQPDI